MNKKLGILLGIIVLLLCITSCKKGNVMNDYPNIEDKNHVFEELEINDVLKKLENKKSFYLILGFPECPWCQSIMPVLNDVAKDNKVKTIYYINIKQIRDNSEAVGHNEYKQLEENYFKDALDVEKNRLNAPTFVKVVNGEMTMYHINTVDTHVLNENMVLPPLTDTELKELKDILNKFFN